MFVKREITKTFFEERFKALKKELKEYFHKEVDKFYFEVKFDYYRPNVEMEVYTKQGNSIIKTIFDETKFQFWSDFKHPVWWTNYVCRIIERLEETLENWEGED